MRKSLSNSKTLWSRSGPVGTRASTEMMNPRASRWCGCRPLDDEEGEEVGEKQEGRYEERLDEQYKPLTVCEPL